MLLLYKNKFPTPPPSPTSQFIITSSPSPVYLTLFSSVASSIEYRFYSYCNFEVSHLFNHSLKCISFESISGEFESRIWNIYLDSSCNFTYHLHQSVEVSILTMLNRATYLFLCAKPTYIAFHYSLIGSSSIILLSIKRKVVTRRSVRTLFVFKPSSHQ